MVDETREAAKSSSTIGEFYRAINGKDDNNLRRLLAEDPKFIITPSDSPPIVQIGCHYNGLHVAAMRNNVTAAKMILEIASSPKFMEVNFPNEDSYTRDRRSRYLVDLYLNTPDKKLNETPLHFAAKFGSYEVAQLLILHPLCVPDRLNIDGLRPFNMIGLRAELDWRDEARFARLFTEKYIVPIWRDPENLKTSRGKVGPAVRLEDLGTKIPSFFYTHYYKIPLSFYEDGDKKSEEQRSAIIPDCIIAAYAGPMKKETAVKLSKSLSRSWAIRSYMSPGFHPESHLMPRTPNSLSRFGSPNSRPGTPKFRPIYLTPDFRPAIETPELLRLNLPVGTPISQFPELDLHNPELNTTGAWEWHRDEKESSPVRVPLGPADQSFSRRKSGLDASANSPTMAVFQEWLTRKEDLAKGIEKVGANYALELGVPWWEMDDTGCFIEAVDERESGTLDEELEKIQEQLTSIKIKHEGEGEEKTASDDDAESDQWFTPPSSPTF